MCACDLRRADRKRSGSERRAMGDFKVMLHLFLIVLIMGTLWRLLSYHLIASSAPHLNHLGLAMSTQY